MTTTKAQKRIRKPRKPKFVSETVAGDVFLRRLDDDIVEHTAACDRRDAPEEEHIYDHRPKRLRLPFVDLGDYVWTDPERTDTGTAGTPQGWIAWPEIVIAIECERCRGVHYDGQTKEDEDTILEWFKGRKCSCPREAEHRAAVLDQWMRMRGTNPT